MMVSDLVLVDTCIWVSFFNRPQSRERQAVEIYSSDPHFDIMLGLRRFSP
jgi:hypothetical protein